MNAMKETAKMAYAQALSLGLDMKLDLTDEQVEYAYNGCGPEWMGDSVREFIDGLSEPLIPAVCVHDCDYSFGDGTVEDFNRANERLESNGIICADARYGWWNPLRYLVRRQARIYARMCKQFGWTSYKDAIAKRKTWEKTKGVQNEQQV